MMMFSVAMKGISCSSWALIIAGKTTRPLVISSRRMRRASVKRNISGMSMRRMALSSRVRSSHWLENVSEKFVDMLLNLRPREQMRSDLYSLAFG